MQHRPFMAPPKVSWRQRLARLRGSSIEFDLRPYEASLAEINRSGEELGKLADPDLRARSREIAAAVRAGTPCDLLLPRAYALVRETARRVVGMRPFDVQILAAMALHQGKVVAMRTGEEKAVVEEIRRVHATGRPVLVGTLTVEESERLAERLRRAGVGCEVLNAKNDAIKGPSSTWTYLVTDDPFRHQLGRMLTGPGRTTFAVGAAMFAAPWFLLWLIVERVFRRRPREGSGR